jgi:hypothetical protein
MTDLIRLIAYATKNPLEFLASAGESAESLDVIFAADAPRGLVEMFAKIPGE